MLKDIVVTHAKENNLKNISVTIPRNKLTVLTGVSGSGKSTLAFDTIFAEGQRRYMESLSSYARQFLGQMSKPNVESITGLSPAISIDQKTTSHNPRSTVGTVTEIYDYLRLFFAHIGTPYCPNCDIPITTQTLDSILDQIFEIGYGERVLITAPIVKGKKGTFVKELEQLKKDGFVRVIVDGETKLLDEEIVLEKNKQHSISVVVDRIELSDSVKTRLTESVEQAIKLTEGVVVVVNGENEYLYSTKYSCPNCGYSVEEIAPRTFSFNSPFGACAECAGIGYKQVMSEQKIVKENLSILEGGLNVTGWNMDAKFGNLFYRAVAKQFDQSLNTPIKDLPRAMLDMILYGTKGQKIEVTYGSKLNPKTAYMKFEGLIPNLTRRYYETNSEYSKRELGKLMVQQECASCHGRRLKPEALSVKIAGINISQLTDMSVVKMIEWFDSLTLNETQTKIATPILKEIRARLNFLNNVGLNYLTLSRTAETLSGGEAQRIRLATQIGSGLTGVLYILDEPSIGLHQRDNDRLLQTLENLRDLDNTVLVVEHDTDTILRADHVVDIGPLAGVHGGEVVVSGTVQDVMKTKESITGKYLTGELHIETPTTRRSIGGNGYIQIKGAAQNNLKEIDVNIPLGVITAVTGVSGSGKSSLVTEILYPAVHNQLNRSELVEGKYKKIVGLEKVDKIINIDQSPIGRTPRSNPATYTNLFTDIRNLFANTNGAKERGYTASRFSFNVPGGRCENCKGGGTNTIEMFFLPDVYVPCEVCGGKRYNRETLQVKYKGKNIFDVLDMTIADAFEFFDNVPRIKNKLATLVDVGLGYIKLGQPATELSGGEAQRVKLASELSKRSTGKSLYILDEPTTGLHMFDVHKLVHILNRLVGKGNTIVVIEHNLDLIKIADYIIDLGPEGGDQGGTLVGVGTPEEIVANKQSYTGKYLKPYLTGKK